MWYWLILLPVAWGAACNTNVICDTALSRCFTFVSTPTSYFKAEQACSAAGGHLASLENAFVGATIGVTAKTSFGGSDYWIGANYVYDRKWSWSDGIKWSYTNWAPGQPAKNEAVAVRPDSNMWTVDEPEASKPYVCELFMGRHCDDDWAWSDETNACYKKFSGEEYSEAENTCVANGGHLVSIHSGRENDFVDDLCGENDEIWIGLHKKDGNWVWTDNSPVGFVNWEEGYPTRGNSGCASVYFDVVDGWAWETYTCKYKLDFVCKRYH